MHQPMQGSAPAQRVASPAGEKLSTLRPDPALLRNALEATGQAILVTGPEIESPGPIIRFANEAMARLTGYAVHELVGSSPRMLQGADTDRAMLDRLKDALRERRSFSGEAVNYRKDGTSYISEWVIDPILDEAGALQGWVSIQRDVTRRRQDRIALQQSEERLRVIFAGASVGLSEIDAGGRFLRVNHELCRILGQSEDELLRTGVREVTYPDDIPPSLAGLESAMTTGSTARLDKRYRRPDGTLVWANSSITQLHDAEGQPGNLLVVTMDITERKAAEAALAESEARLRTLMQGIPQLVWRAREGGKWTWSSPQWQALTGQSLGQSLELGWLDAVHPDDRAATMQAWEQVEATGSLDVEFRVRRAADGAYLWHHTRSLPVFDEPGRVAEWLGTCTDMQQLKELQERQGVMVAELQHRTRNLIAVVRSIAGQTMQRTGPTPAFTEQFNARLGALARVQGLLSRSDEMPVTLDAIIRQELDALGATDRARVEGPSVRLRRSNVQTLALALHELATNARKYGVLSSDVGQLDISWKVRTTESGEPRVVLSWAEELSGTARLAEGTPRRGYGRDLIEKALPYTLGARTTYEIAPHGVRCTIDLPVERQPRERHEG